MPPHPPPNPTCITLKSATGTHIICSDTNVEADEASPFKGPLVKFNDVSLVQILYMRKTVQY